METTIFRTWATKAAAMAAVVLLTGLLASCSESNGDTEEEFPNWQQTNEAYFDDLYATTQQRIASGDTSWKLLRSWALTDDVPEKPTNYVVVQVLEEGTGSGCPLYSDTVRVHFQGRLLPSVSYPEGKVFSQSFYDEYNPATATPTKFAVSALIDGWTTAMQQMHIGDRWRLYLPHQLGYGSTAGDVPAYSTLIFDVTLHSYFRKGADIPDFKAKELLGAEGWIEE